MFNLLVSVIWTRDFDCDLFGKHRLRSAFLSTFCKIGHKYCFVFTLSDFLATLFTCKCPKVRTLMALLHVCVQYYIIGAYGLLKLDDLKCCFCQQIISVFSRNHARLTSNNLINKEYKTMHC